MRFVLAAILGVFLLFGCVGGNGKDKEMADLFLEYRQVSLSYNNASDQLDDDETLMDAINTTDAGTCKAYYNTYRKVRCNSLIQENNNLMDFYIKFGKATNNTECVDKMTKAKELYQQKPSLCEEQVNASLQSCLDAFGLDASYEKWVGSRAIADVAWKKYVDNAEEESKFYKEGYYSCFSK